MEAEGGVIGDNVIGVDTDLFASLSGDVAKENIVIGLLAGGLAGDADGVAREASDGIGEGAGNEG